MEYSIALTGMMNFLLSRKINQNQHKMTIGWQKLMSHVLILISKKENIPGDALDTIQTNVSMLQVSAFLIIIEIVISTENFISITLILSL